ncbi:MULTISPECIES: EamA family transporter RarD [unclassified Arsukibacterium]|uniref:EamA family transporter RarD n=1 Tax=unclassified Arsukibacterium TaxID=2635278 RepID=UPI000C46BA68|nr:MULTISPECIES: EamA family transporter RarD [unclassified Arsukibacterium]MAA94324.1 protein RarD [Rheinheimera sp.]MBM34911.1 protein RarD [Rheinheimera sp.]HAW94573.1 EamA family transporter RarD [Candidatus Azambacteria bacterium]|tara:strand:- start:66992 stop:67906 length:915 start_codon:yes stop_codon:yes gene_type:complete
MSLSREQKLGGAFAASAYSLWGIAPLYFKQIDFIAATEILVHRVVWSCLLLLLVLLALKQGAQLIRLLRQPKLLLWLLFTALILGVNWGLFIWAVNSDHMLDASLGYYINPLLNVLLGMLFLGERLRVLQWLALGLAATGVIIQLVIFGSIPWLALALAGSFAVYGLLRKKLAVEALTGLFVESLLLLPVALLYWWHYADSSAANMLNNSTALNLLLVAAAFVTTIPLLCFIAGARRLQLSTMGFFQYIGPSLMFVFGVWLYHEPLQMANIITFGFIWLALFIYSVDAWRHLRYQRKLLRSAVC